MTFEEYQAHAKTTAVYPSIGASYIYPVLGLANEAGEVAGKVKKVFRDHGGILSSESLQDIKGELGDVLWYVAQVATEMGASLEEIAQMNVDKLRSRKEHGTLKGSGDHR